MPWRWLRLEGIPSNPALPTDRVACRDVEACSNEPEARAGLCVVGVCRYRVVGCCDPVFGALGPVGAAEDASLGIDEPDGGSGWQSLRRSRCEEPGMEPVVEKGRHVRVGDDPIKWTPWFIQDHRQRTGDRIVWAGPVHVKRCREPRNAAGSRRGVGSRRVGACASARRHQTQKTDSGQSEEDWPEQGGRRRPDSNR